VANRLGAASDGAQLRMVWDDTLLWKSPSGERWEMRATSLETKVAQPLGCDCHRAQAGSLCHLPTSTPNRRSPTPKHRHLQRSQSELNWAPFGTAPRGMPPPELRGVFRGPKALPIPARGNARTPHARPRQGGSKALPAHSGIVSAPTHTEAFPSVGLAVGLRNKPQGLLPDVSPEVGAGKTGVG
jgi:hypothetical protein